MRQLIGDPAQENLLHEFLAQRAVPDSNNYFNSLDLSPEESQALQLLVDRGTRATHVTRESICSRPPVTSHQCQIIN